MGSFELVEQRAERPVHELAVAEANQAATPGQAVLIDGSRDPHTGHATKYSISRCSTSHADRDQLRPTPFGLIPERWRLEHWCGICRERVATDQLVAHAQGHERAERAGSGGSFQYPAPSGTMVPGQFVLADSTTPDSSGYDHEPTKEVNQG